MAKLKLLYSNQKNKKRTDFYIDEQGRITKQIIKSGYCSTDTPVAIIKKIIVLIKDNWLEEISVSLCTPEAEIIKEFAEAIKSTKSLKKLWLTYDFFSDKDIIKAIIKNTSLDEIAFIKNKNDVEAVNIIEVLQYNKTLSRVVFENKKRFTQDELEGLTNVFKFNTTITGYLEYKSTEKINKYINRNKKMLDSVATLIKKYFYNNDKDVNPENFDLKDSYVLRWVNLVNKNTLQKLLIKEMHSDNTEVDIEALKQSVVNVIDKAIKYYKDYYYFYNALRKSSEFNMESLFDLLSNELIDKITDYLLAGNLSESIKMTQISKSNQPSEHIDIDVNLPTEVTASGINPISEDS